MNLKTIHRGILVAVVAAVSTLAAAGPANAQGIRIFADDELPSAAEVAEILGQLDPATDAPTTTRGIRLVDPPSSDSRRAANTNRTKAIPRQGRAFGVISVPVRFTFNSESLLSDAFAQLDAIAAGIKRLPLERVVFIEGHTDAVGSAAYNLALSDRRAESVALALTEYFQVPPENLVVQGYGEEFLKVQTAADERANRRASVRRITDLLQ